MEFRKERQSALEGDKAWRNDMEQQKIALQGLTVQAARDQATLRAAELRAKLVAQSSVAHQKAQELQHFSGALSELNGLDYKDGKTPNRIDDILSRFPMAAKDPMITARVGQTIGMHRDYLKAVRADELAATAKKDAAAAVAEAKAAGLTQKDVTTKVGDVTSRFTPGDAKGSSSTAAIQTAYAKSLGALSGLYEARKSATGKDADGVNQKITEHEEKVRSLESQNPGLRATRGLPGEVAPAAVVPITPAPGAVSLPGVTIGTPAPNSQTIVVPADGAAAPVAAPVTTQPGIDPTFAVDDSVPLQTQPAAGGIVPPTTPPVTTATASPAPGGGPGNDRLALAKQAIDDPSATDAHKAAARKLLGL